MPNPSTPHTLSTPRASLARRILERTGDGGMVRPPELPDLMFMRLDEPALNSCSVYEPCVALIVQGSKQLVLGDESLSYGEDRYLITSMDLPVKTALMQASPERPYLAVALRLDWRDIATLMLEMPPASTRRLESHGLAMTTGALTAPLLEAFDRLMALLDQPEHITALAPLIQREIHYRLLTSEAGTRLRQIATVDTHSHQVARAIAQIKARFAEPLRVETLARESGMSLTSFHHHFKSFTAMSPLQYQKQLRLTEARQLMLSERLDAATAAFRVGYESPSQFSREYRRMFGSPPSKDIGGIRRHLDVSADDNPPLSETSSCVNGGTTWMYPDTQKSAA